MVSFKLGKEMEKDVFVLSQTWDKEKIFLYFFTDFKTCHVSYSIYQMTWLQFYAKMERVGIFTAVLGNIYSFIA